MLEADVRNKLLRKLPAHEFAALSPHLQPVDLVLKQRLVSRGEKIEAVYFGEDCVCSLMAETDNVSAIEVGMFGYEGMSNMVIRPGDVSALAIVVQLAGPAYRIEAEDFCRKLKELPGLNELMLRYKEAVAVQFAYTALAHGSFTIEERLARWLLMSHDRAQRDTLPIVHEFLAAMLAVRRSGITTATHVLEGLGAIRATRGSITIRDRAKLLDIAGESYGVPEAEYDRLMSY